VVPRLVLPAYGDSNFAVSHAQSASIIDFLVAPVVQLVKKTDVRQEVRDGWDRIIKSVDFSSVIPGTKPIIISAGINWNLHDNKINVIETAHILDGAKYLNYLSANKINIELPLLVVFNRNELAEMEIRRAISSAQSFSLNDLASKVGTTAPRLSIGDSWVAVTVKSDPFVIKTSLGYTAALLVLEKKSNQTYHIIVGAKSISTELEDLRLSLGSLVGLDLKIRKQANDQRSPYELRQV
jgi:hypothetical protein